METHLEHVATKTDLEKAIGEMKIEIAVAVGKMETTVAESVGDMKASVAESVGEIKMWSIRIMLTTVVSLIGLFFMVYRMLEAKG